MKWSKTIKKYISLYYDYIILILIYGCLHLFMHTDCWDDILTTRVLTDYHLNLFHYLSHVWNTWSSRIVIQGVWAIIGYFPNYIWKILDTIMVVLLYHFSGKIIVFSNNSNSFSNIYKKWQLLLFLCFPYSLMGTAGWMTTTIVYTWTFAFLAYCTYLLFAASAGQKIYFISYFLYGFAALFAGNYNVTAIGMIILLFLAYIFLPKTTSLKILFWEGTIINIVNILLFALAPGNRTRMEADAVYHNSAELLSLSFGGKIRMGINSTFYHFISVPNAVLFITCLLLAVCTVYKTKSITSRFVALMPVILDILWTGYAFLHYTLPNRNLTYIYPDAAFQTSSRIEQSLAMMSAIIMICALLYTVCLLTDFSPLSLGLCSNILFLGLLPEIALGFTTTISASIIRVVTFFYFSLILTAAILTQHCNLLKNKLWRNILTALALFGTAFNILQVIRHIIVYG